MATADDEDRCSRKLSWYLPTAAVRAACPPARVRCRRCSSCCALCVPRRWKGEVWERGVGRRKHGRGGVVFFSPAGTGFSCSLCNSQIPRAEPAHPPGNAADTPWSIALRVAQTLTRVFGSLVESEEGRDSSHLRQRRAAQVVGPGGSRLLSCWEFRAEGNA